MRRGDLLVENTFGTLIAVVCVFLLIAGGFYVYNNFITNKAEKNAKKTLDEIVSVLERLDNGQTTSLTLQGFSDADNWYIVAWSEEDRGRPEKCEFGNCLCICNGVSKEDCQNLGICNQYKDNGVFVESYYPNSELNYPAGQTNTFYPSPRIACVQLKENLYDVLLIKSQDFIKLEVVSGETEEANLPRVCKVVSEGEDFSLNDEPFR
ncbi:MAG: hypothetical protein AABW79_01955 [Nanoarchaeota archaeon]